MFGWWIQERRKRKRKREGVAIGESVLEPLIEAGSNKGSIHTKTKQTRELIDIDARQNQVKNNITQ